MSCSPLIGLLSFGIILTASPMVRGQETATLTTLYNFDEGLPGAVSPGLTLGSDGNLYGTYAGNAIAPGTVFAITPAGQFTGLHSFSGEDGSYPLGALVQGSDGNFYGTTFGAGSNEGTVFRITPGGVLTTLHTFHDSPGSGPTTALVQTNDGNFYGTTSGMDGTLFRITPAGKFKALHTFSGSDGSVPSGPLVQGGDGNLYGTTYQGGDNNDGTLFRLNPKGKFTVLHSFNANDGDGPTGLVLAGDGNLYGTTRSGTIFKSTLTGTLTTFAASVGNDPSPLTLGNDGNFYGTTSENGSQSYGTAYELTMDGTLTVLHVFDGIDGLDPNGLVEGADGNFYGLTELDGANDDGTIFKLTVGSSPAHPAFFNGQVGLGNGAYYLVLPNGNPFGYYAYLSDPAYIYHFSLGYQYVIDAADGKDGVYLYDFISGGFFYTSPTFPFPYLYDFSQNSVVYFEGDTLGIRYFYVFSTGQTISSFLVPTSI